MSTLAVLTSQLEDLCDEVGLSSEIPLDLIERFADAKMAHAEKVGAYVHVIETLKKNAEFYETRAKVLMHRAKVSERLEKEIKERLKYQVENNPNLPWKSDEGDKIGVRKNPESLKLDVQVSHRHVNNVLSEHEAIPVEFITINTFYSLNTDAVRQFLKNGGTLSWARLEQGTHLRIY